MITIPLQPFYVWAMVFLRTVFVLSFFPLFGELFVPVRIGYSMHFRTPIDDTSTQVYQFRFSPSKDGFDAGCVEDRSVCRRST